MSGTVKITFLRHAHSEAPAGASNSARRVSDKGRAQALARREQLGNPAFDLILTSQEIRTPETAMVVAGEGVNTAPMVALYELFTPHSGQVHDSLHRLFSKFGHKSLHHYYTEGDKKDVDNMMHRFGYDGWLAITRYIYQFKAKNVLVIGHGMYPVCMVHASSIPLKDELTTAEPLMDLVQSECDGFVVEATPWEGMDGEDFLRAELVTPLPKLD